MIKIQKAKERGQIYQKLKRTVILIISIGLLLGIGNLLCKIFWLEDSAICPKQINPVPGAEIRFQQQEFSTRFQEIPFEIVNDSGIPIVPSFYPSLEIQLFGKWKKVSIPKHMIYVLLAAPDIETGHSKKFYIKRNEYDYPFIPGTYRSIVKIGYINGNILEDEWQEGVLVSEFTLK